MISTVTTTTVTTITTHAGAASLAVIGVLVLLAVLILKELTSASERRFAHALNRVLNVAIVPLLVTFVFVVAVKVVQALP